MYHRITLLHTGNEHNIVNQLYFNTITKKAKSLISVLDLRCPFERRHGEFRSTEGKLPPCQLWSFLLSVLSEAFSIEV